MLTCLGWRIMSDSFFYITKLPHNSNYLFSSLFCLGWAQMHASCYLHWVPLRVCTISDRSVTWLCFWGYAGCWVGWLGPFLFSSSSLILFFFTWQWQSSKTDTKREEAYESSWGPTRDLAQHLSPPLHPVLPPPATPSSC